jgi:hypothetical protein
MSRNNDHRWPDEHDRHDTHVTRNSLAKLRHKLNIERPARSPAKAVAPKAENPKPRPSGDRFIRPAMPTKKAIVRAVLRDPDASLAELREKMDALGYRISDLTLSVIKQETQYVIRQAEALGLFNRS